jgi:hypothetical protein
MRHRLRKGGRVYAAGIMGFLSGLRTAGSGNGNQ